MSKRREFIYVVEAFTGGLWSPASISLYTPWYSVAQEYKRRCESDNWGIKYRIKKYVREKK
jgi:hypothetical protein